MSELRNPYVPPSHGHPAAIDGPLYAKSPETLVMRVGAPLPDRCLRCGKPTERRRTIKASVFELTIVVVLVSANALGLGVFMVMGIRGAIWLVAALLPALVFAIAHRSLRSPTLKIPNCGDHPRGPLVFLHAFTLALPLLLVLAQPHFGAFRPPHRLFGLPGFLWLPAASYGLHLWVTILWPLPYPIPRAKLEDGYYHLRPVDPAALKELPPWPGD